MEILGKESKMTGNGEQFSFRKQQEEPWRVVFARSNAIIVIGWYPEAVAFLKELTRRPEKDFCFGRARSPHGYRSCHFGCTADSSPCRCRACNYFDFERLTLGLKSITMCFDREAVHNMYKIWSHRANCEVDWYCKEELLFESHENLVN